MDVYIQVYGLYIIYVRLSSALNRSVGALQISLTIILLHCIVLHSIVLYCIDCIVFTLLHIALHFSVLNTFIRVF